MANVDEAAPWGLSALIVGLLDRTVTDNRWAPTLRLALLVGLPLAALIFVVVVSGPCLAMLLGLAATGGAARAITVRRLSHGAQRDLPE